MTMDLTKRKLNENPPFAVRASQDGVVRFKYEATQLLKCAGIDIYNVIKVIPGISQTSGHRAVFLKCTETEKLVFKIELEIDLPEENINYIDKNFSCPEESCNFQDKTFTELANHYLTRHRCSGETISHICCGQMFSFFELFCEHVYNNHRNVSISTVCPNFDQIRQDKFDAYIDRHKVRFLESFEMEVTFNHLLDLGGQIILSFDRYWIFMWNCQDFAVWYLYSLGIPLQVMDPTVSDKITGSNKDSSARKVQGFKGWAWYKQPDQLKKFSSIADQARYTCNDCEFLPPLTLQALTLHHKFAHEERSDEQSNQSPEMTRMETLFHYLRGGGKGYCLDTEAERRWEVYRLRGSSITAHASIIFRPWILRRENQEESVTRSDILVSVEKGFNNKNMPFLYVSDLDEKYAPKLDKCFEFNGSVEELAKYISGVFGGMISKGMTQTCIEFVHYLLKMLNRDKTTENRPKTVESTLLNESLYERANTLIEDEKFVVDVHSMVGYQTLTARGRIAQVVTRWHGRYQSMMPLHIMSMLSLLHFDTIGELLFPIIILFTVYFMYCVVFSHHKIIDKHWVITSSWDSQSKLQSVQDVIHIFSMILMLAEVFLDLGKLQSVIVLQMAWLHFLFINREKDRKCLSLDGNSIGPQLRVYYMLKDNFRENVLGIILIVTFLMPTYVIRSLMLPEFVILFLLSCKFPLWFQLRHLTGHENPPFHFFLFIFLILMSTAITYTGYIITPTASVFSVHILSFVAYFTIAFWEDLKAVFREIKFSNPSYETHYRKMINCGHFDDMRNWRNLYFLQILCWVTFLLPILLSPILLFTFDFKPFLLIVCIIMYVHCLLIVQVVNTKAFIMSVVETATQKEM